MRLRDPGRRPGRPNTLTDVTNVEEERRQQPQPSPLARHRQRSLMEQYREAMRLALEAEDAVRARRALIRDEVASTFYVKRQTLPITLDLMVEKRAGEDGEVNYYIGQNQWQIQRSLMFGIGMLAEQNAKILQLLKAEHDERQRRADDTQSS